jgi:uncharacterized protein
MARARSSQRRGLGFAGLVAALLCAITLGCIGLAFAFSFPPLSGRVVDQAAIIPAPVTTAITAKLDALESKSSIQFVVATVNSLEGDEIEPYANALFRAWKLGEKDKNNGVLLLVAPKEHKARIEVGYGLEGTLTDALSKIIISNAMAPRFKAGDFGGGIERGVDDTITVLTTDSAEWQKRPELRLDRQDSKVDDLTPWIVFGLFLFIVFMLFASPRRGGRQSAISAGGDPRWGAPPQGGWQGAASQRQSSLLGNIFWFLLGMLMNSRGGRGGGGFDGGGGWGGGSSGGGFEGGGGSSGGGGASGSW